MSNKTQSHKLLQAKATIFGIVFAAVGASLIAASQWLDGADLGRFSWIALIPWSELGASLFGIGVIGVAYDFYLRRDEEEQTAERMKATFSDQAPAMRDAVIEGFAFNEEDLRRVGTPELLDQLTENSLSIRFGDKQFAREVYAELLAQSIKSPERWFDAKVDVNITNPPSALGVSTSGANSPSILDIAVRWEFSVKPAFRKRHFAITSDKRVYADLGNDGGDTSVWFKAPSAQLPAQAKETFELLDFTINGQPCEIARTVDLHSQRYSVDLGEEAMHGDRRANISYTYKTRTQANGHVLRFNVDRPTRGFDLEAHYTNSPIRTLRLFDYASIGSNGRMSSDPAATGLKTARYSHDGWLLPGSGIAATWVLDSESAAQEDSDAQQAA